MDWAPLDNVFYQAAKYHVYLIPVIAGQSGSCDDGHWQDPAWYSGGFKNVYDTATASYGSGLTPLSYWDYMDTLVSRYADSPALGMWEPMSEAEASDVPGYVSGKQLLWTPDVSRRGRCRRRTGLLLHHGGSADPFARSRAPRRGGLSRGRAVRHGRQRLPERGASPGIDVLSVHDYYGTAPLGGDQWNGMAVRFAQAKALDKPIITGEFRN